MRFQDNASPEQLTTERGVRGGIQFINAANTVKR